MSDYVSKYTGSEVDGILDEAIELPSTSSLEKDAVLKHTANTEVFWCENPQLPLAEYSDIGKVLMVTNPSGDLYCGTWESIPSSGNSDSDVIGLPDTGALNGDFILICSNNGADIDWVSIDGGELENYGFRFLPAYDTTDDLGKVLMITVNGPEWVTP